MNEPRPATAAQMASRNIRSIKNRRRAAPISSVGVPQSMSFGAIGGAGAGGGIFGTNIQAGGNSFNFSTSGPEAPLFPVSYGPKDSVAAGREEDPRADTSGEEAARRNKPFSFSSNNTHFESSAFGKQGTSVISAPVLSNMSGDIQGTALGSPSVQSNSLGGQPGFNFNSSNGQAQPPNPFSFQTTSQSASPGFSSFGKSATTANNIFNFTAPPSKPASSSPTVDFASRLSREESTDNLFNSQPKPQTAQPSSIFNFGSTGSPAAQEQPASKPFSFGQTSNNATNLGPFIQMDNSQNPPSSSVNFTSATATAEPTPNLFGTLHSTSGMGFNSTAATSQPGSNVFGKPGISSNASTATSQPTSNIFGAISSTSAIVSQATPAGSQNATNLFGTLPSNHTVDGAAQQSMPLSNPFTLASTSAQAVENTPRNFFGSSSAKPLFGNASQESAPTLATSNPTKILFESSSRSLFGGTSQQPATASAMAEESTTNSFGTSTTKPLFGGTPQQQATTSNVAENPIVNLFGTTLTKPLFGPASRETGASSNIFAHLNKPASPSSNIFNNQSTKTSDDSTSAIVDKNPSTTSDGSSLLIPESAAQVNSVNSSSIVSFQPSAIATQTNIKTQVSPMKPVDAPSNAQQPPPIGMFPSLTASAPAKTSNAARNSETSPAVTTIKDKRPNFPEAQVNLNGTTGADYDSIYTEMARASSITDDQLAPLVPPTFNESQKNEFYAAYRLRSLNKAIEKFFATISFGTGLSNLIACYNEKKVEILDRSSLRVPGSKRKYTDDGAENQDSAKRSRQTIPPQSNILTPHTAQNRSHLDKRDADQKNPNPAPRSESETASNSSIFKVAQSRIQTTQIAKKSRDENQSQSSLNGSTDDTDRLDSETLSKLPPSVPSMKSFMPTKTSPSRAFVATPLHGKRKADFQLTKDDYEKEEQEDTQMKTFSTNGDTNRSSTSNIFKGILDSPGKASPEKTIAPLQGTPSSKTNAPRTNPSGGLPIPKSPAKISAPVSGRTTNMFTPGPNASMNIFGPTSSTDAPNIFAPKAAQSVTNTNPFTSKPAFTESKPDAAKFLQNGPPKFGPPKFGPGPAAGNADFLAQFTAKAREQKELTENKLMAKAMEDELDSSEDEETIDQWKAEWTAKRKAQLEDYEKISKGGKGFVPGDNGKQSDSVTSPMLGHGPAKSLPNDNAHAATQSKPLFLQPTQSADNSVSSSRTSTPGPFGSSTESILDGHTSAGHLATIGAGNIFSHLTPDSASDAHADEDTSGESDGEEDSENKDPNYIPNDDGGNSPGTPVDETGPGIASAKNTPHGLMERNADDFAVESADSASGTTTQRKGLSLFDRVQRDSNGDFLRGDSPENDENIQPVPSVSSPFAGLNKTPAGPADQTWKPDGPIRFGSPSSTTNDGAAPKVSITEATPSKASTPSIFANLNTIESTPKPTFSNLFGNLTPKAPTLGIPTSTGFSFGTSPGSSLFPSVAASGVTSRATSPGNTTDGASDYEDPDAEKHEQIDLSAGGPGEEDEQKLYEVRAKALQWTTKDGERGSFVVKGVGPLRVLKHKETGASRLVLRGDPAGNIILNKALLASVAYKANKKTVTVPAAADGGTGMETWLLQVREIEWAEKLAGILESNK